MRVEAWELLAQRMSKIIVDWRADVISSYNEENWGVVSYQECSVTQRLQISSGAVSQMWCLTSMETKTGLRLTGPLYFSAHQYKSAWEKRSGGAGGGRGAWRGLAVSSVEESTCKAAILSESKFPKRSHFDIIFGGFNRVIWKVLEGTHLISLQNKFSFCCNSSLSNLILLPYTALYCILPYTAACNLEEARGTSFSLLITESAWCPCSLMRHRN